MRAPAQQTVHSSQFTNRDPDERTRKMVSMDKEWTQKYVGSPLASTDSSSQSPRQLESADPETPTSVEARPAEGSALDKHLPSPPSSASPSRREFHPSNPFSPKHKSASQFEPSSPPNRQQRLSPPLSPSNGVNRSLSVTSSSRPPSYRTLPLSGHQSNITRSTSARDPNSASSVRAQDGDGNHRSLLDSPIGRQRSASGTEANSRQNPHSHSRNPSLNERFPGDMSHRPLDIIKRETRAADRAPYRRHRQRVSNTDVIDALDTIGGAYHHDGPYDATLASRNMNELYSPVAAVHDSNMEAIRATPREYIQDSLTRHVPLQGTSTIPSGAPDMSGKVMTYEEGADLMRESDAPGGAYKRWHGVSYHPDDLKGKGEPSYTFERDAKLKQRLLASGQEAGDYEMQPRRQRSVSNAEATGFSARYRDAFAEDNDGMQRSNSTGRRISDGLKRRFGSVRRKKNISVGDVQ